MSTRDAQTDDLLAALAERNIYSRGDLAAALATPPEPMDPVLFVRWDAIAARLAERDR